VRTGGLAASPMHICRAEKYRAESVTGKANASVCKAELDGCWHEQWSGVSVQVERPMQVVERVRLGDSGGRHGNGPDKASETLMG